MASLPVGTGPWYPHFLPDHEWTSLTFPMAPSCIIFTAMRYATCECICMPICVTMLFFDACCVIFLVSSTVWHMGFWQ